MSFASYLHHSTVFEGIVSRHHVLLRLNQTF
jgi:hypothetical protein